jgi:hypothetical protein
MKQNAPISISLLLYIPWLRLQRALVKMIKLKRETHTIASDKEMTNLVLRYYVQQKFLKGRWNQDTLTCTITLFLSAI